MQRQQPRRRSPSTRGLASSTVALAMRSAVLGALCAVLGLSGCGTNNSGGGDNSGSGNGSWSPGSQDATGGWSFDGGGGGLPDAATGTGSIGDGGISGNGEDGGPVVDDPAATLDQDQDGWTPKQGDCNDFDAKISPAGIETCNGRDDDCNGQVDDIDTDSDGFSLCPGPNQDCDDHDPKVHPAATPNCTNGKDNDCNGVIDAIEDVDKDGFNTCNDCDDLDANVFTGAPSNCENGKDNDCDGVIDGMFDGDKDGFSQCNDCDDADPNIHAGSIETCNNKDNDCNGVIDDMDNDGDGYSGCSNDCDDSDINVNPGAGRNCKNGKDNDCSGVADDKEDGDGDGFAGCADCNDYNPFINPNAMEFAADFTDNNCNGVTDEAPAACDDGTLAGNDPKLYPKSIGLCSNVASTTLAVQAAATSHKIMTKYGSVLKPTAGKSMVVMSSGKVAAKGDPGYTAPQSGTSFSNSAPYPPVNCKNSGSVYDYTEWKMVLQVPATSQSFSFDFNFMSSEYPEWVGTQFNDKFLAILDSKKFKGNVSFDKKGNCISINNAFFTVCKGCQQGETELAGTGYEGGVGGGTGWLTTTSPVEPGETITLRFIVFDEGDHILDSAVLIDNFRWDVKAASGGPSTVRPGG